MRNMPLGAAFGAPKSGSRPGMFGAKRRSEGEAQKFSYPNNQCPGGYTQTGSGSDRPPQGYSKPWGDYVLCRPQARATSAPTAPAAPTFNPTITVSPAIQTQISPQISPIFQQTQDSPGAVQAGSATQSMPGGQTASGGGSGTAPSGGDGTAAAMLDFMRAQSEREEQRRAAEDQYRREQQERQRQAQAEAEQRAAKEQAQRDEQAAAMQAQYEAQLKESQKQAPSTFTSHVQPNATYIPANEPDPVPSTQTQPEKTLNWPLIAGAVVVVGGVAYFMLAKPNKRK